MPHYDYLCADCGHEKEIFQKMTEEALVECPQCLQQTFKRKIGAGVGLQFRGSGFYITDYGDKAASSSNEAPTSSPAKGCGCKKNTCSSGG